MSILAVWIGSKIPRAWDFIQSLPAGSFITFALCFLLAQLIGKAIGHVVSSKVKSKTSKPQAAAVTSKRTSRSKAATRNKMSTTHDNNEPRKEGVATPEELQAFVDKAGDRLLVVDTRTTDFSAEPGDQTSLAVAGLPTETYRVKAKNLVWDRVKQTMPELPADVPKDTPIITHCGAGTRGGLAKAFLEEHGFTNVINGGGPKEKECWAVYGDK